MTESTSCHLYTCVCVGVCLLVWYGGGVWRSVQNTWGPQCWRTEGSQPPVCFMELVQMHFLNVRRHAFLLVVVFHSILVSHAFVRHAHLETVVFVLCSTCHGHSCHRPAKWRNRWWCLLPRPASVCPSPWTRYCYLQFVWGWCQLCFCVYRFLFVCCFLFVLRMLVFNVQRSGFVDGFCCFVFVLVLLV